MQPTKDTLKASVKKPYNLLVAPKNNVARSQHRMVRTVAISDPRRVGEDDTPSPVRADEEGFIESLSGRKLKTVVQDITTADNQIKRASPLPSSPLPFISGVDAQRFKDAHKPVLLVLASAHILGWSIQVSLGTGAPLWLPLATGSFLGLTYSILNRLIVKHVWRSPSSPLNVVVTGGAKGIGKALAREFLRANDRVIITSRTQEGADAAVRALKQQVGPSVEVYGLACDITDPASVEYLAREAVVVMGAVDVWLNNAGYSGSFKSLMELSPEAIQQVVATNLTGTILATQAAMRLMSNQPKGGHIFNMDGAGSDNSPTPNYAAYGSTKAGIAQLYKTLQTEAATAPGSPVSIHNLSPGMVLTDLLLEGATPENKVVFNILCEYPETVAAFLVPRARSVVAKGEAGAYIRYLTPGRALAKFAAWPVNAGRYFNSNGEAVYPPEEARVLGDSRKKVERLQKRAASRSSGIGLAYSFSIAAAYLILVMDSVAKAHGG